MVVFARAAEPSMTLVVAYAVLRCILRCKVYYLSVVARHSCQKNCVKALDCRINSIFKKYAQNQADK